MQFLRRKLLSALAAGTVAAAFVFVGATSAAASVNATCSGGSIAAGPYRSLTITGFCLLNSGNVSVDRNVDIRPGGTLIAAYDGSNLTVGRDLLVESGGSVVLGCEPFTGVQCVGDADGATTHSIGHNLVADGAREVIAHHNTIWGELAQSGGGGGKFCDFSGGLATLVFSTYEDNQIHGDATVADLKTCWLGFIRNTVWGDANLNDNQTADPDGNEFVTNVVHGNLSCFENNPAAQVGDSGGAPNQVGGLARGQCVALSVPLV